MINVLGLLRSAFATGCSHLGNVQNSKTLRAKQDAESFGNDLVCRNAHLQAGILGLCPPAGGLKPGATKPLSGARQERRIGRLATGPAGGVCGGKTMNFSWAVTLGLFAIRAATEKEQEKGQWTLPEKS